jgi:ubiquinone/menaquinone biosynthesis C-methylase UbiE
VSMPPDDLTEAVHDYWNASTCGTWRPGAPKYSSDYFAEIEHFRYLHEPFIHAFAQFPRWRGARVLEVGVGAGTDFAQWVRSGARANGVDLTEEAIENTRRRLALEGLEAESLQVANAEALPFPDGHFDLVYSWGVIHHAADTEACLREIYRVTRPGGHVKVMVYQRHSLFALTVWGRHALLRGRPRQDLRTTIANNVESAGTKAFTVAEIRDMVADLPHEDLVFNHYDQKIRRGARFEKPRRLLDDLTPDPARWYLAFELTKKE